MARLRGLWKVLAAASVVLLAAIRVLAPDYGDAQTAATADAFRAAFADADRPRYVAATVVDLFFAASYALLAVSCSLWVDAARPVLSKIARCGAAFVVMGAVLDEIENARLLGNISSYRTVGNDAIDQMTAVGPAKLALGFGGAAIVVLCLAASRWSSRD